MSTALERELKAWGEEAASLRRVAEDYRRGGHPLSGEAMEARARELEHRISRIREVTGLTDAVVEWRRANAHCCPRCGWHLSSHGHSHGYQSDCAGSRSPSARDGSLQRAQAAGLLELTR